MPLDTCGNQVTLRVDIHEDVSKTTIQKNKLTKMRKQITFTYRYLIII